MSSARDQVPLNPSRIHVGADVVYDAIISRVFPPRSEREEKPRRFQEDVRSAERNSSGAALRTELIDSNLLGSSSRTNGIPVSREFIKAARAYVTDALQTAQSVARCGRIGA